MSERPAPAIDPNLLERLINLASTSPTPLAAMSMNDIAASLGMTRMTLYRRAGTRDQIVAALARQGVDARMPPDVHERVVEATARLLRQEPLAGITLERIAGEANCSLPALYARFGNREGVLTAVIERYSPVIPVRDAVAAEIEAVGVDLRHDIRLLYATVLPRVLAEWPVMRSLLAEVLRDPASDVSHALREWYLPQVTAVLVPLFQRHLDQGTIRPLPLPILVQFLIAPLGLHSATREVIINDLGFDLPDIEGTIDMLTDMFCRAVGTDDPTHS